MVPGNLMLLPLFVLMSKLQLIDSYAGLVLPFAAGAFGVFLMRQFMQSIPDELLEAARMDGAGEWYIFWRIVMPLVKPALATLSIFTFLGSWNNFVWPLIATNDPDKYTLPVALATFATDPNKAGGSNGMLMAGLPAGRPARRGPVHRAPAALHPGHRHGGHEVARPAAPPKRTGPRPHTRGHTPSSQRDSLR